MSHELKVEAPINASTAVDLVDPDGTVLARVTVHRQDADNSEGERGEWLDVDVIATAGRWDHARGLAWASPKDRTVTDVPTNGGVVALEAWKDDPRAGIPICVECGVPEDGSADDKRYCGTCGDPSFVPTDGPRPSVPFARREFVKGRCFATCPACGEQIEEVARKDFESYTGEEYAAHYLREHSPKVTVAPEVKAFGIPDEACTSSGATLCPECGTPEDGSADDRRYCGTCGDPGFVPTEPMGISDVPTSEYAPGFDAEGGTFGKATIYHRGLMGVTKVEAREGKVERVKYAQYDRALKVTFKKPRQRNARTFTETDGSSLLILDGWGHPDPAGIWDESSKITNAEGTTTMRGRYSACDPRWQSDFDKLANAYLARKGDEVKVLWDTRGEVIS